MPLSDAANPDKPGDGHREVALRWLAHSRCGRQVHCPRCHSGDVVVIGKAKVDLCPTCGSKKTIWHALCRVCKFWWYCPGKR